MKKHLTFLIALLVGIVALVIPASAHAMSQKDLAGKVYLVTFNKPSNPSKSDHMYYFFDRKGKAASEYVTGFNDDGSPAIDVDNATENEKKAPKRINKMLTNKKYCVSTCKEDNSFKMKNGVAHFDNGIIEEVDKWTLQDGGNPNDFTLKCNDGDGEFDEAHFQLAPQNYQYKFNW